MRKKSVLRVCDRTIKFAPEIILGEIARRAADQQFTVKTFSSPSRNVIVATCERVERFGRRIAKIDFSVRVTISATVRTQARITPGRNLELVYAVVNVDVNIDITPDPLEWIADGLMLGGSAQDLFLIER